MQTARRNITMQLRKVILGLATVTMLASCGAKQISKAEAIKLAQENYDASNQVYKSAHYKTVTEALYSDNVPEVMREVKSSTNEGEMTDPEEIAWFRLDSNDFKDLDEKEVTFKADGKKLEISSSKTSTEDGITYTTYKSVKCDEIGYILEEYGETKTSATMSSGVVYEVTIKTTMTLTWSK